MEIKNTGAQQCHALKSHCCGENDSVKYTVFVYLLLFNQTQCNDIALGNDLVINCLFII